MNPRLTKQYAALSDKRRLSMMIAFTGCLTFVSWMSLEKFVDVFNSQISTQTIMDLENEISQLRMKYHDAHPETLEGDLKQAEHHVIQDYTHLAQWIQNIQEEGEQLALQMNYRILRTQQSPSSIQGITIMPLELQIRSRDDRSGYRSFLQFLQALEHSGPRITLEEVTINGDGKKATHFTIGLSTWIKTQQSVEL